MAVATGKSVDAAEKSPNVYSANWKEDMILQRQLQVLNRTEKSVVHRITIDQKVLYRRFQTKLLRSKIAHARMHGDKDKERGLRSKNLKGLNTDCGNTEEDLAFLKRLENRPCTVDVSGLLGRPKMVRKSTSLTEKIDSIIADTYEEQDVEYVTPRLPPAERQRSKSLCEQYLQNYPMPDTKIRPFSNKPFPAVPVVNLPVRPATSIGTRVENELQFPPLETSLKPSKVVSTYVGPVTIKNCFVDEGLQDFSIDASKPSKVSFKIRPQTGTRKPPDDNLETQSQYRRHSLQKVHDGRSTSEHKKSFFEEEKKINVVEKQLSEARNLDYSPRIREFCDSLKDLENVDGNTDYYTIRLQAAIAQGQGFKRTSMPGTPEAEHRRSMGNLRAKSLTLKTLNLDFQGQSSSLIEAPTIR